MSNMAPMAGLRGRRRECQVLGGVVNSIRGGRSQVLVLRGEAGIGKTALLEFLIANSAGCQVARAAGVESELLLAYAGLHQMCRPYIDRIDRLPAPQAVSLGRAFGLQSGGAPDRFAVGLAVLTLLSEVGEEQPLICVVDDAQWLDQASLQALEFVARRLEAEAVALVLSVCDTTDGPKFAGLPDLVVRGLDLDSASAILDWSMPGKLDHRVRERILAEARGNPLALLEVPRRITATELAFSGVSMAGKGVGPGDRLQASFAKELSALPPPTRKLLLLAAADPVGDLALMKRASERVGLGLRSIGPAEAAGLIDLRGAVRFRHPMVRSAVYRAASAAEHREAHRALAEVTDPARDPDRLAWHRARATPGPDEGAAVDLERSAARAMTTGGIAAAGTFLQLAATLSGDPHRRAERSLDAAEAKAAAGDFAEAECLLAAAQAGPLDPAGLARADLVRGRIRLNSEWGSESCALLAAADRLEPLDPALARKLCLEVLSGAVFAGRLSPASTGGTCQVAKAVRRAVSSEVSSKSDFLLDGVAKFLTEGYSKAAPVLRRAVKAFGDEELTLEEALPSGWLPALSAVELSDDYRWDLITQTHLDLVRTVGALGLLPLAVSGRSMFAVHSGDLAAAAALVAEGQWVSEVIGAESNLTPIAGAWLAAVRGDGSAEWLIADTLSHARLSGQGLAVNMLECARAVLCNGLGRYESALGAAQGAAADATVIGTTRWALAEMIEAGVRSDNVRAAACAYEQLSAATSDSGTDLALGVDAASSALLHEGSSAEDLYREAIERLGRTRIRIGLARARLLYGEWLRRRGRRVDARAQLRTAYEALTAMGVEAFADRARRELLATGETVRRRSVATSRDLTSQETHIARLAAEGLTNPEIAAALYLSRRTVEWHLRKVFTKLGVDSRRQLSHRLDTPARG